MQKKYGVEFHKYWINEKAGKIFYLVDAPNAEAAVHVHREAHGQLAEEIIEIQPEVAELFLGSAESERRKGPFSFPVQLRRGIPEFAPSSLPTSWTRRR